MVPIAAERRIFVEKACGKTWTLDPVNRAMTPEKEQAILGALAERISQRGIARALKVSRLTIREIRKKNAKRIEARIESRSLARVPAPADDVIEMDELCIRKSPSLWLWLAVSRVVGQVLGFVIGDRTEAMLSICWADVPLDYRDKPVRTDSWEAYARFFSTEQHKACPKGSGETSRIEGWNTKWRQRQSGLVRRSCGVSARIEDDLVERFLELIERHSAECARRWRTSNPSN